MSAVCCDNNHNRVYLKKGCRQGFSGKKRNIYQSWQFSASYVHDTQLWTITNGRKYTPEHACSPAKKQKTKFVEHLNGKFISKRIQYLSNTDWNNFIHCLTTNVDTHSYKWDGQSMTMHLKKHNTNHKKIYVTIVGKDCTYEFTLEMTVP